MHEATAQQWFQRIELILVAWTYTSMGKSIKHNLVQIIKVAPFSSLHALLFQVISKRLRKHIEQSKCLDLHGTKAGCFRE
jgi:hypothetical protein